MKQKRARPKLACIRACPECQSANESANAVLRRLSTVLRVPIAIRVGKTLGGGGGTQLVVGNQSIDL